MADTRYNPYAHNPDDTFHGAHKSKPSWLDAFPHGTGWGPRTPDPDAPAGSADAQATDLTWRGVEGDHHITWRFDMRRHGHH